MAVMKRQESGLEDIPTEISNDQPRQPLWKRVKAAVFKNFLPISLVFFAVFGITLPQPGVFFSELPTQYVCVVGLFLHSGLKLRTAEVKDALRSFKAFLWGVICILLLTPIIGGHLTGLMPYQPYLSTDLPEENGVHLTGNHSTNTSLSPSPNEGQSEGSSILGPALFQIGIQIYFIVPCTISAGVILVSGKYT